MMAPLSSQDSMLLVLMVGSFGGSFNDDKGRGEAPARLAGGDFEALRLARS